MSRSAVPPIKNFDTRSIETVAFIVLFRCIRHASAVTVINDRETASMWKQITMGSAVMAVSSALHISVLVAAFDLFPRLSDQFGGSGWALIVAAFVAILVGHTLQVWVWALILKIVNAIGSFEDAVYFAVVTSTTLGYGDVTLERKWRLFGAMAAVNGLLTFGLSTAFLLEVFNGIYGA